jgi:hypothetical protein
LFTDPFPNICTFLENKDWTLFSLNHQWEVSKHICEFVFIVKLLWIRKRSLAFRWMAHDNLYLY